MRQWQRTVGRWSARTGGTSITDAEFMQALDPRLATSGRFPDYLATRQAPRFHVETGRARAILDCMRAGFPLAEPQTVMAAERARAHEFDLLGSGSTALGSPIDWHVDFKTGRRWPARAYYLDLHPAAYPGGYDIKVPWELSRCQHLVWLGQAYWFTGNEKYAEEFVAQVGHWINYNPPSQGVNWACTMDVAIRAVNWLWAYAFFEASPSLTGQFRQLIFKSLLAHGRHIMANLERSDIGSNNHYLADIVGLVYLGIMLPEFKEAKHWREFGLQELAHELEAQVYPDGVNFEASVPYHRLATELFLMGTLLARLHGYNLDAVFLKRLEAMLEFVMYVTKPDGTAPQIGDNDNGRLVRLAVWAEPDREWLDYRYLLAIGAVLFEREDFARAAGDQWQEAIWCFGDRALDLQKAVSANCKRQLKLESRAFLTSGLYVLRHEDLFMAVDTGPVGQNGNGGHAHRDTLSFELFAQGQSWILDPGSYIYTGDYRARNQFRSAEYHNVVSVVEPGAGELEDRRLFRLESEPRAAVNQWITTSAFDFLAASQAKPTQRGDQIRFQRVILFDKQSRLWVLRDVVKGSAGARLQWHWHFAPSVRLEIGPTGAQAVGDDGSRLRLISLGAHREMSWQILSGWVSPSYGRRIEAPVLRCERAMVSSAMWTVALIPTGGNVESDRERLDRSLKLFDQMLVSLDSAGEKSEEGS